MKIKFVDLQRQNKTIKKQLMTSIEEVVDQADFNMGPRLQKFESDFAAFCGKKYAVGVNSGVDALTLPLMAHGIGPGDEVIVPANSYFATAMVVSNVGAKPIFVDIDPISYTIDVALVEKAITPATRAIIPVHIYGQPADMGPIMRLAKKHKLIVIEDACQAHGSMYKKRMIPYGETGAFSFFPGKNLGCFGDGGAVVTDNKKIAEKILHLRNDGSYKKYVHTMLGVKSRLDTLQATILSVKLPHLAQWNSARRKHANSYSNLLKGINGIKTPEQNKDAGHVFHAYVIETKKRDVLQKFLHEKGIETIIHYPTPIHLQKPYIKQGFKRGDFPITEEKSKRILSLPMFPELQEEEIKYVCDSIREFITKNK
jgi:dTDP-4-amino-4,6-dideoxygalactose transaminase